MSAHDVAVAAMGFGSALVFVRSYDWARAYRREAAFKRVRAAYIASKVVPLHFNGYSTSANEAKPLNYLDRELAEHTCSFGDQCNVRRLARQMEES